MIIVAESCLIITMFSNQPASTCVFYQLVIPLFMYTACKTQPPAQFIQPSNITAFLWTTLSPLTRLLFWKGAPEATCVTFPNRTLTAIHVADQGYTHAQTTTLHTRTIGADVVMHM